MKTTLATILEFSFENCWKQNRERSFSLSKSTLQEVHINRCKLNCCIQLLEQQMSPPEIPALALLGRCGVGPAASLCHLCPPPAHRGRAAAERGKDVQNGMLGEPRVYLQGPSSPQPLAEGKAGCQQILFSAFEPRRECEGIVNVAKKDEHTRPVKLFFRI